MNIIGKRIIWYILSTLMVIVSITALFIWGINPGADFTGGTLIEVGFNKNVPAKIVEESLKDLDLPSLSVSSAGQDSVLIKTKAREAGDIDKIVDTISVNLKSNPELEINTVVKKQSQIIGPSIGKDLTKRAAQAVVVAIVAIVLYIAWSFRKVQKPFTSWSMSIATIIALAHDIIIILGFVSITNHYYGFEANSYLLVVILTILGFSVHDTIVVFDRIRENILKSPSNIVFEKIVNDSINQTLGRSLNTSLTAVLVLLALATIGGGSIKSFIITLLAGIIIGTYSSIFVGSPLLVTWTKIKRSKTT